MQKILSAIGIGSLTLVILLALSLTSVSASHVQTPVSESSTSIDLQSTQTKFIEIERTLSTPALTYFYNLHGYTGTLQRVSFEKITENSYEVVYAGYVQCTGLCPGATQPEE